MHSYVVLSNYVMCNFGFQFLDSETMLLSVLVYLCVVLVSIHIVIIHGTTLAVSGFLKISLTYT